MTYQVYATVTGAKQGVFKGSSTQKGREGKIRVASVNYGVSIPHDASSVLATGRRMQQPVSFSLEWDSSSTQFFSAAFANETLTSVLFEYFGTNSKGIEALDHTVKLTNASMTAVQEAYASTTLPGAADGKDMQTVTLSFQKIEITNSVTGGSAIDELRANV
jgi:type VI secretion system secreted protein Hcp